MGTGVRGREREKEGREGEDKFSGGGKKVDRMCGMLDDSNFLIKY